MFKLNPKEDKFFPLFITWARLINKGAVLLQDMLREVSTAPLKLREMEEIKRQGEEKRHQLITQLQNSFITPLDREDLYELGQKLAELMVAVERAADGFILFDVKRATQEALKLAALMKRATQELCRLIEELRLLNKSKKLQSNIREINRLVQEGEGLFRQALAALFQGQAPVREILQWQTNYAYLREALEGCGAVARLVEGLVIKYA